MVIPRVLLLVLFLHSHCTFSSLRLTKQWRKVTAGAIVTFSISNIEGIGCGVGLNSLMPPLTANAEEVWTSRNQLAAETWKAVDEGFYERTFNGNDWFQLRQSVVKRQYTDDEEVYDALKVRTLKFPYHSLTSSQYVHVPYQHLYEIEGYAGKVRRPVYSFPDAHSILHAAKQCKGRANRGKLQVMPFST